MDGIRTIELPKDHKFKSEEEIFNAIVREITGRASPVQHSIPAIGKALVFLICTMPRVETIVEAKDALHSFADLAEQWIPGVFALVKEGTTIVATRAPAE